MGDLRDGTSFIIPVYNSANFIVDTLEKLFFAIDYADLMTFEVLIIDDGSTDNLKEVLQDFLNMNSHRDIRLIHQNNFGRFAARAKGLQLSKYDSLFFIDSRVHVLSDAIAELLVFMRQAQDGKAFIANIIYDEGANLIGIFWSALERMAWSNFHLDHRNLELTRQNFNQVPKGTTMIVFDKSELIRVHEQFVLLHGDGYFVSDDTELIRIMLLNSKIYVVEKFRAFYIPRRKLVPFLKHAFFRGQMALSGYFAPGTLGRKLYYALLLLVIPSIVFFAIYPIIPILTFSASFCILIFFVIRSKLPPKSVCSLLLLGFPFAIFYNAGILRSVFRKKLSHG